MSAEDKAQMDSVPVVIYVPGLGSHESNSAAAVAEALAGSLDRPRPDLTISTRTSEGVAAPPGLTVGRTIVDQDARPLLQLFQFDYASALDHSTSAITPSVAPGMVRSTAYACWGFRQWLRALDRPAKTARTKMQLLLGFAACAALLLGALVAAYALLVALGVDWPWIEWSWVEKVFGTEKQTQGAWTFGLSSIGLTITWAAVRENILALSASAQRMIRFVQNQDAVANTIVVRLDQAIDQLRGTGWNGPIHLLGYSFGSLVVLEASCPRQSANLSSEPGASIASMVTIACPLDLVRLYAPGYVDARTARRSDLPWLNVFNEADIFASNLMDGDDTAAGVGTLAVGGVTPTSIKHTDEKIGLFQIFFSGRTHSRYWGARDESSCFDPVAARLIAAPTQPTHPAQPAQA